MTVVSKHRRSAAGLGTIWLALSCILSLMSFRSFRLVARFHLPVLESNDKEVMVWDNQQDMAFQTYKENALEKLKCEIHEAIDDGIHNTTSRPLVDAGLESDSYTSSCTSDEVIQLCSRRRPCQVPVHETEPSLGIPSEPECRTLWFSAFTLDEGYDCSSPRSIPHEYSTALLSAQYHAANALQPVLLLGKTSSDAGDLGVHKRIVEWARRRGAIVVSVEQLSLHDDIARWHKDESLGESHLMGPYLRMEIPWIIEKFDLFNRPGVCQHRQVLYTDADTVFMDSVSHEDVVNLNEYMTHRMVPSSLSILNFLRSRWGFRGGRPVNPPSLLYGREHSAKSSKPQNTGVLWMNVPQFGREIQEMVRFRNENEGVIKFEAFDQGWINSYYEVKNPDGRHMLPIGWNWKLYWQNSGSIPVKLVHFHGPKPPNLGAWHIATCNASATENDSVVPSAYLNYILEGICCDSGRTALKVQRFVEQDLNMPSWTYFCTA